MWCAKTKVLAFLLAPLILLSQGGTAYAEGEYPTWPQDFPKGVFRLSALPTAGSNWRGLTNTGLIGKVIENGEFKDVKSCSSMNDPKCADVTAWGASSLFDFCSETQAIDCIEKVEVVKSNGEVIPVKLGQVFPGPRPQDYLGDPEMNLPSGGSTRLFSIPDAPHSSGDKYLLVISTKSSFQENRILSNSRRFINDLFMNLFAVEVKSGKFNYYPYSTDKNEYREFLAKTNQGYGSGSTMLGGSIDESNKCVLSNENVCATPVPLPLDLNFKITLRTSFRPGGNNGAWFSGRVTDLSINVNPGLNGSYRFEVGGSPIASPTVSRMVNLAEIPQSLNDFYRSHPNQTYGGLFFQNGNLTYTQALDQFEISTWSFERRLGDYNTDTLDEFVRWLPLLGDKASALPTMWSVIPITFGRLGPNGNSQAQNELNCLDATSRIAGFVATNATQYVETWPTINKAEGSIEYRVAAPHFEPDGKTVFKGTYDLAINEDVARCIYSFSAAPIKATVQVTSSTGQEQIATTTLRKENGMLYLSAKGFTFSSPTIKVRLYQDKAPESVPTTQVENVKVKKATKIITKSIS